MSQVQGLRAFLELSGFWTDAPPEDEIETRSQAEDALSIVHGPLLTVALWLLGALVVIQGRRGG